MFPPGKWFKEHSPSRPGQESTGQVNYNQLSSKTELTLLYKTTHNALSALLDLR